MIHTFQKQLVVFLFGFSLLFSTTIPAYGQNEIQVTQNQATLVFPYSVIFSASIEASAPIEQVQLIYSTNAHSCLTSTAQVEVQVSHKSSTTAEWTWMASALPPGAVVTWQWRIKDSAGHEIFTPNQKLTVDDPHYTWQRTQAGKISISWSKGDANFGQLILNTAAASLARISKSLKINEPNQVRLLIYPNSTEMRDAVMYIQDWAGGVAFPAYDTIMIGIDPQDLEWIASVVPHELAHMVIDQRIDNCEGNSLPTWLNEGLAVFSEGPTSTEDRDLVMQALQRGDALELRSLAAGFPPDSSKARLAYAQSGMVATFLVNTYGAGDLDQLLELVKKGTLINEALLKVYQLDTLGLDQAWRTSLGFAGTLIAAITGSPTAKAQRTAVPTLDFYGQPTQTSTLVPTPAPENPPTPTIPATLTAISKPPATPTGTPVPAAPAGQSAPPVWAWLIAAAGAIIVVIAILLVRTRGGSST